ncbi:MAG: ABC transporter permease [Candidatus Limnocylindrales bacterium]
METIGQVAAWFGNTATWGGAGGIPVRIGEHLALTAAAMALACLVALPIGLVVGHTGRGGGLAIAVANIGRAVPSYALLLLLFPIFGLDFALALPALVLLAIPPILTNAYVAVRDVDPDLVEAGRGMGLGERQLLQRVEVPVALPVIVAGIRTAAVQVVATATLAALVAGGGLGRFIVDGFALRDDGMLIGGAILVALLAVAVERGLSQVEQRLVSPGIRTPGLGEPSGGAAEAQA